MCSDKVKSVLLSSRLSEDLKELWACVMDEMKEYAPTLLNVLLSCTKTDQPRSNQIAIVSKFRYTQYSTMCLDKVKLVIQSSRLS